MPYKEHEIKKLYYSIGDVAKELNVNISLIRFWEREFNLKLKKNKQGNRVFSENDLETLRLIYNLVKERGYKLQGAKDYIKSNKFGEEIEKQRAIKSLTEIKKFLMELKRQL